MARCDDKCKMQNYGCRMVGVRGLLRANSRSVGVGARTTRKTSLLQQEKGDRLRWMRCYKVCLRKSALEKLTPHPSYSRCSYATFSHRRRLIIRRFATFFRRGGVSPPVFTLQSNVFGRGDPSPTVSIGRARRKGDPQNKPSPTGEGSFFQNAKKEPRRAPSGRLFSSQARNYNELWHL